MELSTTVSIDELKAVLIETFDLEDRGETLDATTPLLGSLPELDSMGVLELIVVLEQRFGIVIEGEDVTADVFETLETLTAFVDDKLRSNP